MFLRLKRRLRHFYKVPWCVPPWGWNEFKATVQCILTGHIIVGAHAKAFSDAITSYSGVRYAIPVNRGRVAIELAIRALGLNAHHEVILPSYLCHSVLEAVLRTGVRPVFADVGQDLHMSPENVQAAITPQTRCVIVPHLFGNTAPVDEIEVMLKGSGIALVDDAAQSFGARRAGRLIGTFGECGIISCGPGKAFAGDGGGLLITNDKRLFERAAAVPLAQESSFPVAKRTLSFWVWRRFRKYTLPFKLAIARTFGEESEPPYVACTISNLDAAIALQQFRVLERNRIRRHENSEILRRAVGELASYIISDFSENCGLLKLVLILPEGTLSAEDFIERLSEVGIECQRSYFPLHFQMKTNRARLECTEALWNRVVCIPVDVRYKKEKSLFKIKTEEPLNVSSKQ